MMDDALTHPYLVHSWSPRPPLDSGRRGGTLPWLTGGSGCSLSRQARRVHQGQPCSLGHTPRWARLGRGGASSEDGMPPTGGGMDSVPRMDSGGASSAPCPPKGPAGMSFVALPAPIASTLPAPAPIEPLLGQSSAEREALITASQERRRELTEAGQILNRVVYDSMVFVPGSADRVPGGALLFESRFESGNLRRAVHVNGNEYDLLLNWDHGTRGHTQWYFFSVSNAHAGESYTFNIVNFCKPQSLCAFARLRARLSAAILHARLAPASQAARASSGAHLSSCEPLTHMHDDQGAPAASLLLSRCFVAHRFACCIPCHAHPALVMCRQVQEWHAASGLFGCGREQAWAWVDARGHGRLLPRERRLTQGQGTREGRQRAVSLDAVVLVGARVRQRHRLLRHVS